MNSRRLVKEQVMSIIQVRTCNVYAHPEQCNTQSKSNVYAHPEQCNTQCVRTSRAVQHTVQVQCVRTSRAVQHTVQVQCVRTSRAVKHTIQVCNRCLLSDHMCLMHKPVLLALNHTLCNAPSEAVTEYEPRSQS